MITAPGFINSPVTNDLRFLCVEAQLPSVGMQTSQFFHNGYGVQEKRPIASIFEDVSLTFLLDANGGAVDFFRQWITYINPFMIDGAAERDKFRWPKDYSTTIDVRKFKADGKTTMTYKLHQAYPVTIGAVALGWEQQNTLSRLPVNFAYHSWTYTKGDSA